MKTSSTLCMLGLTALLACDETSAGSRADAGPAGDGGPADFSSGTELTVDVSADGKSYVRLEDPSVLGAEAAATADWDLALSGYNVFTNSGPSGPGQAAAFGPLDTAVFLSDQAPQTPFLTQDKTGGAFVGWYYYDGDSHYLYGRYHTFGVKDGARLWKVQIITYYGERNGGPVSALYKIRYAELGQSPGATQTILLDGTAGGANAPASAPSGCVDLGSGELIQLTPTEAAQSSAWHLCARRDAIAVNGGISGPRGVTSTDLDSAKSPTESLSDLKTRTEASTQAAFDAITAESFTNAQFVVDGPVSAFRDLWIDRANSPPTSGYGAWVVRSAKSAQLYLVAFPEFTGATANTPSQVTLSIKKVSGTTQ